MRRSAIALALAPLLAPGLAAAEEGGSVIRVLPRSASSSPATLEAPRSASSSPATPEAPRALPRALPRLAPRAEPQPRPSALVAARPEQGPRVLPWATLGASAALAVVGAVFAAEAASGLDGESLELVIEGDRARVTDDFRDAQGRVIDQTILSTALLSTAAAGAVMSLILLLEDI